jgi:hypothetical protein
VDAQPFVLLVLPDLLAAYRVRGEPQTVVGDRLAAHRAEDRLEPLEGPLRAALDQLLPRLRSGELAI